MFIRWPTQRSNKLTWWMLQHYFIQQKTNLDHSA
jgi:hypothetical protein